MKTLIMADIHANLPALEAVLEAALPCDRIVFLGDLANFGPHPAACVDRLEALKPLCIMGNHDQQIVSEQPRNFWDRWSKEQLNNHQQDWIRTFSETMVLDDHILLVHGAYGVAYDLLPNTSDEDIRTAFRDLLTPGIDQVWFGHYHYQIDRVIDGVEYHCIRPVGHHRDKDTRASYSLYEHGVLTHHRVTYNLPQTIADFNRLDIFEDPAGKAMFADFLKKAFHEELLKKDLQQMAKNDAQGQHR